MKLPKPAPVTSGVDEAAHQVALRNDELDAIRAEIGAAEAALPALALDDNDARYEEATLKIDRLKRSEMRAQKRLEAAREAHADAIEHEEQDRRKQLHEAGIKAASEAEKLAYAYREHASAIAEVFRAIDKLRPPVEAANLSLPEGERRIDAHALEIHRDVDLPAATKDGPKFWWRAGDWTPGPLDPPPPPILKYIEHNGAFVQFDEANPAHIAARHTSPTPAPRAPKPPSQPVTEFGERTLPDGSRKIMLPPNQWPPKPASASN